MKTILYLILLIMLAIYIYGKYESFPIGINRFFIYIPENNRDNLPTCDYMKILRYHGIRYIRVFVAEPMFEPRIGIYDEYYIKRMDRMFECAEKLGMKIILVLFDHYAFRFKWNESAYNVRNGGIIDKPVKLYTNVKAVEYEKNRMKFLVERYKDSPALFAWEPINELDGIFKNPLYALLWKRKALEWFKMMKAYIKSIDPNHMVTESLTGDKFWDELNDEVDFIQIHTYRAKKWDDIPKVVKEYINLLDKYDKLKIIGEFAPKKDYIERSRYVRTFLWSTMTAKIPAWLWTHKYDPYGDVTEDDLKTYSSFSKFANELNLYNLKYMGRAEKYFEYTGYIFAGKFEKYVIGYIPSVVNEKLVIKGIRGKLNWVNPIDSECIETVELQCKEACKVKIPDLSDIAFFIELVDDRN